jgi:hypothetical protein
LNRLQSKDFATYKAFTYGDVEFENLKPMTDMEELRRLGQTQGLGQEYYESDAGDDPELRETLAEFGLPTQ